jgi:hypothetical protein
MAGLIMTLHTETVDEVAGKKKGGKFPPLA